MYSSIRRAIHLGSLLAAVTMSATLVPGVAAAADSSALGGKLTPLGGNKSASEDGMVPAWVDPGPQGPGWTYGKLRADFWKYKGDKPLFAITEANLDKYADKLPAGHVEVLKKIKSFRMDVYPSRRTCSAPDFVLENTKKNVDFAKLDASGSALQEAWLPGVPFPMPQSGVEVMINMKMRYRGLAVDMSRITAAVSPRKGSDEWLRIVSDVFMAYPWGDKGSATYSSFDRLETMFYYNYLEPTALAGQAGVSTSKAGEATETFSYFPGQRRVRRMPSYSYDAPQIGLDNQYTVDEQNIFTGELDRFDWKLIGKKEMIVPYNSFGGYDFKAKFDEVATRDFIAPSHRRYETHRVWIVEATVKQGMRHSAPKRIFYIDEDSWAPLAAVDFDAQGRPWKVREGYLIPVFETGACDVEAMSQYNLADGRYLLDWSSLAGGKDIRWISTPENNPRLKRGFYTSDNLRAISER